MCDRALLYGGLVNLSTSDSNTLQRPATHCNTLQHNATQGLAAQRSSRALQVLILHGCSGASSTRNAYSVERDLPYAERDLHYVQRDIHDVMWKRTLKVVNLHGCSGETSKRDLYL